MDRRIVIDFNKAYSMEAAPEERQLVTDLLTVWGKFETAAAKNPALIRKGILYGMALQKLIAAGEVSFRPIRGKRQGPKPEAPAEKGTPEL